MPLLSSYNGISKRSVSPAFAAVIVILATYGALVLLTGTTSMLKSSASTAAAAQTLIHHTDAYRASAATNISALRSQLLQKWVDDWQIPPTEVGQLFTQDDWAFFKPVISCPKDRPLRVYGGSGDGSKLLCDLGARHLQGNCIIYSLGSRGNFKFEIDMLQTTGCEIHTFDCTIDASSIKPGRHFQHKLCVGKPSSPDPLFKTYSQIVKMLGHTRVDLLKMDIEGWEYGVFAEFQPDDPLPAEISTELHVLKPQAKVKPPHPVDKAGLSLVFLHLANLGYAAYSMEVNPIRPSCCSEFSFMRFWPLV